ncbi:hypothetical protein AB0D49_13165 [Streptomyces sp. NPDC048290]|uniref:hypothetical protein n=1 Tax=Streptomyces sp. NPDC048290 TaxID=3155811 RepID=UPI00341516F8
MSVRARIALLCALFAVLGSPSAQEPLREVYADHYDSALVRWPLDALFVVHWDASAEMYPGAVPLSVVYASAGLTLLLFAGLAVAFTGRGTTGWFRSLAAGLLAAQLAGVLRWALYTRYGHDPALEYDFALRTLLRGASLDFGVLSGVLLALLTAGLPRLTRGAGPVAVPRRPARQTKGSVGMTSAAQPHMPVGREPGDVTRYLCTAAYVDEAFADRVVEEVVADEASAAAPSPEVDLVAVAHHSLAAKELRYARDLRLTAALGVVLVAAPLWVLMPVVSVPLAAGGARPSLATRGVHEPARQAVTAAALRAAALVLAAFLVGFGLSALGLSGVSAWLFGGYGGGVPAALISLAASAYAYATVVRHRIETDRLLRSTLARDRFYRQPLPPLPPRPWIAARMAALSDARYGNVTVYSGHSPFQGYAETTSGWSIAVPLLPADEPAFGATAGARPRTGGTGDGPVPFTVAELVGHVRERLREVAHPDADAEAGAVGDGLGSLLVEDRVFASGTGIGEDSRFTVEGRISPAARLTPEQVEEIMLHPTGAVRHCLAVHVPLWGGDVVPNVFLHFSTAGRTLHLHCENHVLGPVAAAYHVVDRLQGPLTPDARRGLALTAAARCAPLLYGAPLAALRHHRFEHRHQRRMLDELTAMQQDPVFDYGARISIREIGLSPSYQNYFQVVDAGRIVSAVQRHTLAAIREFLDTRGYDVGDFRAQQQTILNHGLIQQGGMSVVGSQAIGTGASATQNVGQGAA